MTMAVRETARSPIEIWSNLGWVRRRIATAKRLFLFLDFDGTLAPIVNNPADATLPAELKATLRALSKCEDVVPVIISGRSLDDVRERVGLPLIFAGDHGLEIRGAGLEYSVPQAQELRYQLLGLCNTLRARLDLFPGALVECKRLTASVHVRQVERAQVPVIRDSLLSEVRRYPAFQISCGKEVYDIRPRVAWNKGAAARWILERQSGDPGDAICMGDDTTDEDLFSSFADGITIRAGWSGKTSAHYWVAGPDVPRFLSVVAETVGELRHTHAAR